MNKQFIKDCLEKRTTITDTANNSFVKYINYTNDISNCIISNESKIEMLRKSISIKNMMLAIENIQKAMWNKNITLIF